MEIYREELEEIVDKKVEERLKQQETAHNESEAQGKTGQKEPDSNLSRRNFLKALGGGAAGLGAAAMIPSAAGFRVNSNKGLSYYNSSSANKSQFEVGPNGILDAKQIGTDKNPVGSIHSETTNTGEQSFKTQNSGRTRRVAPSESNGYDSVSAAITDAAEGDRVLILEDVTEDNINPKPDMTIEGVPAVSDKGSSYPTITISTPDAYGFIHDGDRSGVRAAQGVTYRNLRFDGDGRTGKGAILTSSQGWETKIENVYVTGCQRGIGTFEGCYHNVISRVRVEDADYGVYIGYDGSTSTTQLLFDEWCRLEGDIAGAYIGRASDIYFREVNFPPGGGAGAIVDGGGSKSYNVHFDGCHFEGLSDSAISLRNIEPFSIRNCEFRDTGGADGPAIILEPGTDEIVGHGDIMNNDEVGSGTNFLETDKQGTIRNVAFDGNDYETGVGTLEFSPMKRPMYSENDDKWILNQPLDANAGVKTGGSNIDLKGGKLLGALKTTLQVQSSKPAGSNWIAIQDGTNWDPAGTGEKEVVAELNGTVVQLS